MSVIDPFCLMDHMSLGILVTEHFQVKGYLWIYEFYYQSICTCQYVKSEGKK